MMYCISDARKLPVELKYSRTDLQNGYVEDEVARALYKCSNVSLVNVEVEFKNFAVFSFYKPVSGRVGHFLLKKSEIQLTYRPPMKFG